MDDQLDPAGPETTARLAQQVDDLIAACMRDHGQAWHTGYLSALHEYVSAHGRMRARPAEETGEEPANGRVPAASEAPPVDPNQDVLSRLSELDRRAWVSDALACQGGARSRLGLADHRER